MLFLRKKKEEENLCSPFFLSKTQSFTHMHPLFFPPSLLDTYWREDAKPCFFNEGSRVEPILSGGLFLRTLETKKRCTFKFFVIFFFFNVY